MGKMKEIAIALEEAMDAGLMPRIPEKVWVLTCDGKVIGAYLRSDTAEFDMHMCREADSLEAGELHEYAVTEAKLHNEFWSCV